MSEEFRYIPYSPYDMNLKGLIKDGGVYNLKDAKGFEKGLSGILLPESMYDSDELIRDMEYMRQMYPDDIKKISDVVEEECDKLEYEGSPMLVEYPDREEMRKIARKVYGDLNEKGEIPDEYRVSGSEAAVSRQDEPPYVPDGPGDVNCVMRNIIEMLVCTEFCVRRDRHRRRRRRFY